MGGLILDNLSVSYGQHHALRGISLTVRGGDYLCIVGENGSGKSTLLKAILGLVNLSSGSIRRGEGFESWNTGYLPQQTDIQRDFPATVREVVLSGFLGHKGLLPFYTSAEKDMAHANLKTLGICDLSGKSYRALSGGQQQRVLLARALCAASGALFLDEPTNGLDPSARRELYGLLRKKHSEGWTILMATHEIRSAVEEASTILQLGGSVEYYGPAGEYLSSPQYKLLRDGVV